MTIQTSTEDDSTDPAQSSSALAMLISEHSRLTKFAWFLVRPLPLYKWRNLLKRFGLPDWVKKFISGVLSLLGIGTLALAWSVISEIAAWLESNPWILVYGLTAVLLLSLVAIRELPSVLLKLLEDHTLRFEGESCYILRAGVIKCSLRLVSSVPRPPKPRELRIIEIEIDRKIVGENIPLQPLEQRATDTTQSLRYSMYYELPVLRWSVFKQAVDGKDWVNLVLRGNAGRVSLNFSQQIQPEGPFPEQVPPAVRDGDK